MKGRKNKEKEEEERKGKRLGLLMFVCVLMRDGSSRWMEAREETWDRMSERMS